MYCSTQRVVVHYSTIPKIHVGKGDWGVGQLQTACSSCETVFKHAARLRIHHSIFMVLYDDSIPALIEACARRLG